jgi:uncharacterized protein YggE
MRGPVLLALGIAAGICLPARGQAPPPERVIAVTGEGEISVKPDTVDVMLGVEHQASSAREAIERTSRAMQAVIERLRREGVPERSIRTATLRLDPVYQQPEQGRSEPRLVGYRASNNVTVTLSDVQRAGPVLDAALSAGANQVQGIAFRLADELPHRLAALKKASDQARTKARAVAEGFGVTLGRLESVSESATVIPGPRYEAFAARAGGGGVPVQPGEITVRAEVTARYRIEGG